MVRKVLVMSSNIASQPSHKVMIYSLHYVSNDKSRGLLKRSDILSDIKSDIRYRSDK